METLIDFLSAHWEASILPIALWIAARLLPTKRNYDLVEMLLIAIGKIIPNRRKDSLGNPKEK